jgi:hypothetical protein
VIAQLGMRGGPNWQPRVTDHYRFALTRPELDGLLIALATPRQVDALAVALEEGPLDEVQETYLRNAAQAAQGRASARSDAARCPPRD